MLTFGVAIQRVSLAKLHATNVTLESLESSGIDLILDGLFGSAEMTGHFVTEDLLGKSSVRRFGVEFQ